MDSEEGNRVYARRGGGGHNVLPPHPPFDFGAQKSLVGIGLIQQARGQDSTAK